MERGDGRLFTRGRRAYLCGHTRRADSDHSSCVGSESEYLSRFGLERTRICVIRSCNAKLDDVRIFNSLLFGRDRDASAPRNHVLSSSPKRTRGIARSAHKSNERYRDHRTDFDDWIVFVFHGKGNARVFSRSSTLDGNDIDCGESLDFRGFLKKASFLSFRSLIFLIRQKTQVPPLSPMFLVSGPSVIFFT